jgi:hypothetical protein
MEYLLNAFLLFMDYRYSKFFVERIENCKGPFFVEAKWAD